MGGLGDYKPAMAMVGLQFNYAGIALITRATFLQGMSPRVFVLYRQVIATLIMAPIAYCFSMRTSFGVRSLAWILLAALFGITCNQTAYFEGVYLSSSTMASAISNLIPAVTFVMATIAGVEKVNIRSSKSIAKILGTVFGVCGAIAMALLKGTKLLGTEYSPVKTSSGLEGENWLMGCLFLFASCCCWSFWMVLQVPLSASCPDHLLSTSCMCLFGTLQSAILMLFLEQDPEAWKMHTNLEFGCCFFGGISSVVSFLVQAWCISERGPLFAAMFNPLCTVIVATFAAIFLHEEIYCGSLIGSLAVIIGLYIVLWGKTEDLEQMKQEADPKPPNEQTRIELIDENSDKATCKSDLEKPFLF